jgi:hypothetical protein
MEFHVAKSQACTDEQKLANLKETRYGQVLMIVCEAHVLVSNRKYINIQK